MAIKYVYLRDMHAELDQSLDMLESKLAIEYESPPTSRYARLRRIAEAVLVANEKSRNIQPDPESSIDDRIQSLKERVISHLKRQLNVTGSEGKLVSLEDTIKGFKGLCDGDYDHLPEVAFYMVGSIDEAVEKAERLAAEAA